MVLAAGLTLVIPFRLLAAFLGFEGGQLPKPQAKDDADDQQQFDEQKKVFVHPSALGHGRQTALRGRCARSDLRCFSLLQTLE